MATESSILAWRSPRTEEPGRLQRAEHNLATKHQHTFLYTLYFHKNLNRQEEGRRKERKKGGREEEEGNT